MQRIHLRNEAKTTTLEKLVPHLGTLDATRAQLHGVKELAKKKMSMISGTGSPSFKISTLS
jgi:hypothetical protein